MEAMRKIVEAEKMEEKRRRKAAKIAHMVCPYYFPLLHCRLADFWGHRLGIMIL